MDPEPELTKMTLHPPKLKSTERIFVARVHVVRKVHACSPAMI